MPMGEPGPITARDQVDLPAAHADELEMTSECDLLLGTRPQPRLPELVDDLGDVEPHGIGTYTRRTA
jgi:hypothetical protein